jgi:hypothetical protein|tara:strand:- start:80 stop:496 length:417 start_codon:yes stop_codon:yes gene_type:complete
MARPRIRQFAGDLGISYDKAKGLINEGRRRKDGGAQVLESGMNKMRGFEAGGTLSRAAEKLNEREAEIEKMAKIATEDTKIDVNVDKSPKDKTAKKAKHGRKKTNKADGGTVYAESGKYMSCRGMGAAVQGNKFTGVK